FDEAAGHQVVEDDLEAEDGAEVDAFGLEAFAGALLAVDEDEGVTDEEAGFSQAGGGLGDAAATGDEVVHDDGGLAVAVDAFDDELFAGRVEVDHGLLGDEGVCGGDVQAAEGDAGDDVKGRDLGVTHGLESGDLFVHDHGGAPEGVRMADELADV